MTSGEILVVDHVPDREGFAWPVVASLPPRVAVLQAGADDLAAIARSSRLAMARTDDGRIRVVGDETALDELDDGARLFVDAWRSQAPAKSHRPGDGLPWDAPGFEPPDAPPGRGRS